MFKRKMLLASSFLLPLIGVWIYHITVLKSSDLEYYQNMIQMRAIASSSSLSPTNQHRKQVRKDIWFSQDNSSRLHYQIASESSLLTLTPVENKFEIVESLQGIKCWMQDKLLTSEIDEEPS
ncbi:MAG: hypothetical protein K1000chlam2_01817, partial [Chlamydiae bacterium]|nr:hypothetical protein [Chlamydiota bacterium]